MILLNFSQLRQIERDYPGILSQIRHFKKTTPPACPSCKQPNTAHQLFGITGRSIVICSATNQTHLSPNSTPKSSFFCPTCQNNF